MTKAIIKGRKGLPTFIDAECGGDPNWNAGDTARYTVKKFWDLWEAAGKQLVINYKYKNSLPWDCLMIMINARAFTVWEKAFALQRDDASPKYICIYNFRF